MSDQPLFQHMDEQERIYAPEELPPGDPEAARVRADEGALPARPEEPPAAAPIANMGNAPSAAMAAPNIGHSSGDEAPGAPDPVAGDPLDSDDH
jgi:hypothetical protein